MHWQNNIFDYKSGELILLGTNIIINFKIFNYFNIKYNPLFKINENIIFQPGLKTKN